MSEAKDETPQDEHTKFWLRKVNSHSPLKERNKVRAVHIYRDCGYLNALIEGEDDDPTMIEVDADEVEKFGLPICRSCVRRSSRPVKGISPLDPRNLTVPVQPLLAEWVNDHFNHSDAPLEVNHDHISELFALLAKGQMKIWPMSARDKAKFDEYLESQGDKAAAENLDEDGMLPYEDDEEQSDE